MLCNYLAGTIDPEDWNDAEKLIIDRTRNRAVTFGVAPHRCIGSNTRMSLRITVEELLKRVTDMKFVEGRREERISFYPSTWRACNSLPVTSTPLPV